jgi:transcriptional regulator with XRE-family HTH domain
MEKSLSQGDEIRAICKRLGLTPAQLADLVPMKAETMRKVVNGYQPASYRAMQHIREVERTMARSLTSSPLEGSATGSAYGIMKLETLQRNLVEVAEQLEHAVPPERRDLLNNLKAMLSELERRELPTPEPPSRGPLTEAQNIALHASENLEHGHSDSVPPQNASA